MKLRSLAIGLTLLTSGTVIGVTTTQFAAASVSSGDKPILVPIEPCRLVDTRPGDATIGPRSSPLGAADTLTVDAQETGTPCTGVVPTDALSLALNVTALNATQQTFLTIWASGARPDTSSLNPAPGAPPTPNAVTVDLSADQKFAIYNNLGSVNVIVDIAGYYVDHNHDDLYTRSTDVDAALGLKADNDAVYTRTEVDALLVQQTSSAAAVNSDGTLRRGTDGVASTKIGATGWYSVDFGRDVTACFFTATPGALDALNPDASMATTSPRLNRPTAVFVQINAADGTLLDSDFTLVVLC